MNYLSIKSGKTSLLALASLLLLLLFLFGALAPNAMEDKKLDPTEQTAAQDKIDISPTPEDKVYAIQYDKPKWKEILSDFEYKVLRDKGTEYAFTSPLDKEYGPGIYYSRATGQPLFSSEHKYDSRSGWPSFWRPINDKAIDYFVDRKFGMTRIEVTDSSSGSHLGHVFTDGPDPTGYRYCINGVSLIFVPEGEEPPQIVKDYLQKFPEENPANKNS